MANYPETKNWTLWWKSEDFAKNTEYAEVWNPIEFTV